MNTPLTTIIMPIRNEADYIERSLGAVLAQDYPAEYMEILVVDGMSDDGTREYIQSLLPQHPHLQLIDNPAQIVAPGFNEALRRARGEIIVRVDGHCEIAPDYVRQCVTHLQNSDIDGVGGPIETIGETDESRVIALAMSSRFGVGGSAFRTIKDRSLLVETVPFPAYTRETIQKNGYLDEELVRNQDDEYNYRLLKAGGKILLASDIRSRYYSRGTLRSLWRQYFQYGYWKVRVLQKHPRQMRARQFVPPLFAFALTTTAVTGPFFHFARLLGFAISGAYLLVNLIASGVTAVRNAQSQSRRALFLLPPIFGILHLGYGFGFLLGLVKFWRRWQD